MMLQHFTDSEIKELISLDDAKRVVKKAFEMWGDNKAATTQRMRAHVDGVMCSSMVAVVPPYSGGKIYSTNKGVFNFMNVLFDSEGLLLCTLDGDVITRMRTAATVSIAIDLLAPKSVVRCALLGAGKQSEMLLEVMFKTFPKTQVSLFDPNPGALKRLSTCFPHRSLQISFTNSSADAVLDADLIVTATSSATPLFDNSVVKDTALICAVGATKAGLCEVDPTVVEKTGAVICDDVLGSKVECGDLIEAVNQSKFSWDRAVQFRDLLLGREIIDFDKGPILFETQGVALQDVALSSLVWERHNEFDRKDPYI